MNRFGKKILCGCLAVSLMLTSVGCSEKTENAEEQTISVEKAARVNNEISREIPSLSLSANRA